MGIDKTAANQGYKRKRTGSPKPNLEQTPVPGAPKKNCSHRNQKIKISGIPSNASRCLNFSLDNEPNKSSTDKNNKVEAVANLFEGLRFFR